VAAPDYAAISRGILLADTVWASLVPADRAVLRRAPPSVTSLFVKIQASAQPVDGAGVMWRPRIQLDAFAPQDDDSEDLVYAVADRAALVLGRVRNYVVDSVSIRGRHTDGPLLDVDTSRGDDTPLSRAFIACLFTVHRR
jgi:hypothetical protein